MIQIADILANSIEDILEPGMELKMYRRGVWIKRIDCKYLLISCEWGLFICALASFRDWLVYWRIAVRV